MAHPLPKSGQMPPGLCYNGTEDIATRLSRDLSASGDGKTNTAMIGLSKQTFEDEL